MNTEELLIEKNFIPLDKSWIIRMGVLDLLHGKANRSIKFLSKQKYLNDDLKALEKALGSWDKKQVDVGESGTLYRFLQFISWKQGLNKTFIKHGTLKDREINTNPEIVNYSLAELLKLDNSTSQWASAAVLSGNTKKIKPTPFKLNTTYEAVRHWDQRTEWGKSWNPRYDQTILNQATCFMELMKKGEAYFRPEQAEDYCFARVFGYVTKEKGGRLWPNLFGHESNRIEEVETELKAVKLGKPITSQDHRVVQALVMYQKLNNLPIKVKYRQVVNKSWPQFWRFLEYA